MTCSGSSSNSISFEADERQREFDRQLGLRQQRFGETQWGNQFLADQYQSDFDRTLAENQFLSADQRNRFAQQLAANQFLSDDQKTQFAQRMAQNQFTADQVQAEFDRLMQQNQFAQQDQALQFAQTMAQNEFLSDQQAQQFAQQLAQNQFLSDEQKTNFAQVMAANQWTAEQAQREFNNLLAQNEFLQQDALVQDQLTGSAFDRNLAARQQSISEELTRHGLAGQRAQELASLMSQQSPVGQPNFPGVPQVQLDPPDIEALQSLQATLEAEIAALEAQGKHAEAEGKRNLLVSVGSILATFFSDRRLKTAIRKVGKLANGLSLYRFRYIWGGPEHVGLMSDEVRRVRPEAVTVHPSGFDMVNYAEAIR